MKLSKFLGLSRTHVGLKHRSFQEYFAQKKIGNSKFFCAEINVYFQGDGASPFSVLLWEAIFYTIGVEMKMTRPQNIQFWKKNIFKN